MEETQLGFIYRRFLSGTCTEEEIEFLFNRFKTEHRQELEELILKELKSEDDTGTADDEAEILENVYLRVKNIIHPEKKEFRKPMYRRFLYQITAAAVLLICFSFGVWIYLDKWKRDQPPAKLAKQEVHDAAPGGNKAVLILGNGQRVSLSDVSAGEIAEEAGIVITKSDDGQLAYTISGNLAKDHSRPVFNTIETPKGGQYRINLPDGTKVWLNAASSLTFPTSFWGPERVVELTGEGYFEVAVNKDKPFKVTSYGQNIEVLGTHFNVNSYTDEDGIKTTLLEGSVKVSSTSVGRAQILSPGQQSTFQGNSFTVEEVNAGEAVAWKDGYFQFNQSDLKTVMRELARWYDVTVRYEGDIKPLRFGGAIQRDLQLSQALKILEKSQVHFRIEGKEVIVMP